MARCLRCARDFPTGESACHTCGLSFPPASPGTNRGKSKPPSLPAKYEILRFLGRGAMGRVYHCRDRRLEVDVAVKVLPSDVSDDEEAVGQLTKEAQAAARLRDCDGILTLHAFDEFEGNWFLDMEFAPGGSLRDWLRVAGPLPEAECRRIGSEVASSLDYAHKNGILHRDIKPDNVLVDGRGRSKVSDFGIARVRSMLSLRGTIPTIAGTPPYMAPEIFQRKPVDGRADLYSLGCMLYELSTGSLPHGGTLEEILFAKTLPGPPLPSPRALNPALGEAFASVVLRLVERDPGARFQDGAACAEALASRAMPGGSRPVPPEAGVLGPGRVAELVRFFHEARKDGAAEFTVDQASGVLHFVGGQCVNAQLGMPLGRSRVEKKGEDAFFDLLALDSGKFALSFLRRPTVLAISRSTEVLLQEAASAAPPPSPSTLTTPLPDRAGSPSVPLTCPHCRSETLVPLDSIDPKAGVFKCGTCGALNPLATDGQALTSLVGEVISDCRIIEKIGEGGIAGVYRAMDQHLRRQVALKVMDPFKVERVSAAFLMEAIAAAQLKHPSIVAIHKIGKDEKRNLHYVIMEFVEGRILESVVKEEGPLPPRDAVAIAIQVLGALAAGHAAQVLHRDLTPGCLILDPRGVVKVTDFGLCKGYQYDEERKTIWGVPNYMAPELFSLGKSDVRTDLYAMGSTLYFLLSGAHPFVAETVPEMIVALKTREPRSLLEARPGLPPALWEIVRRLIAKKPEDRPADAASVGAELEAWLREADRPLPETVAGPRGRCGNCSREWSGDTNFCSGCGANLRNGAPAP